MNASIQPGNAGAECIVPVQFQCEKRLHPDTAKHGLGRLSADLVGVLLDIQCVTTWKPGQGICQIAGLVDDRIASSMCLDSAVSGFGL